MAATREMRIRQEIVLGIAGYRALNAMGYEPTVYHMNEGHSAFLALEHVRTLRRKFDLNFDQARQLASASLVFTTHTPVEAGHDYFPPELMQRYFGGMARDLELSEQSFLDLGLAPGAHDFCMTVLALSLASRSNGVSRLHGAVSRKMWQGLWPDVPVDEIPIGHVTNGVHFRSWISLEMNQLYDRYLSPSWREEPATDIWSRVHRIPAEELWRTHERRRERLVGWARSRVRSQRVRRGASQAEIAAAVEVLDPEALSIGFARRFATYKRATLIFHDMQRLRRILTDPVRPVQLIFAGKAHPADDAGKELIRQIVVLSRDPELGRRIVFLEDYDMSVTRYLVQGVDVWLNTPLRPMEASGTSGMKAAANGVLNLSTLDGWWDEVWRDPAMPPTIGWAIGNGESYDDLNYQDQVEAETLYDVLEHDVIPTFYDRGRDRIPRRWVDRMKGSIGSLCHFVNTHRMVRDYMFGYYEPAHERFRSLQNDGAERARELAAALQRIAIQWNDVWVGEIDETPRAKVSVASEVSIGGDVHLGALTPEEVVVELYLGRVDAHGEIVEGEATPMIPRGMRNGMHHYVAQTAIDRSGRHGFTIRVRPHHPDLTHGFLPGMIKWASARALQGVC
ncbi:MAG TPA: alpha-glucan family phosphorylase [Candidatus Koribacter sp.]|jgi:starch phosphorylase